MKSLLFLLILIPNVACGLSLDNVTFNNRPTRVVYNGVLGAFIDEYEDFARKEWYRELDRKYDGGILSISELIAEQRKTADIFHDARITPWWNRNWTLSLSSAPKTCVVIIGPKDDVIDLGFASFNNKFKFRFKKYETQLSSLWDISIGPYADFSVRHPWLLRTSLRCKLKYKSRACQLSVILEAGWKFTSHEGYFSAMLVIAEW